jgi:superfamily II DNA or RNA helicase
VITLELGNVFIKIVFENVNDKTIEWVWSQIHTTFDPLDPERFRKRPYNLRKSNGDRVWDGRVNLCEEKDHLVPLGFYDRLMILMRSIEQSSGIVVKVVDKRGSALHFELPSEVNLDGHGKEKDLTLRDYQYEAVQQVNIEQSGIILNAVNAGKTASAVTLFKYLLPKINEGQHLLFIAPNKSIMNQIYLKYQHYLSEDIVGIWGDGKKDISHPIICATIQTLASAIKEPKTKPTRKKDKLLGRFAERYAPAILESGDPRSNLELLARNFHPNYKYEQDDIEELRNLYMNLQTSDDVKDYFEGVQKRYKKLLYSLNEDAYEKYYDAIDLLNNTRAVVCDEAHRAGAESYWKVFHYLTNARVKVGLTGTLDKTKKISMAHIRGLFGKDLVKVTNKQMIERGVSARPHIRLVPIDEPTDLEPRIQATMMAKGYSQLPTADLLSYQIAYDLGVVHNEYRNRVVAELAYKASSKLDKQAVLIMVTSIEHGELIGEQLDKLGAEYQFLQGKDDSATREKAIDDIVSGKLKIVIATKIFEAGIDIPNLKVLILCDALKSYISVIQKIGRVLRVMPDKRDVFIFDIVDRTQNSLFKHAQDRVRYYKDEGFEVK